jgi:hypothetical protein
MKKRIGIITLIIAFCVSIAYAVPPTPPVSDASEGTKGILETATDAEAVAHTATDKAVVPSNLDNVFAAPPAIGGTTPAAGAFTTLTASTSLTAPFKEERESATDNVSAAQCYGSVINNYGQSDNATLTLPAAAVGMHFTVILGTTVAKYYRLDPNANDYIILDGVASTDGKYVGVASATIGDTISFRSVQTGASEYNWVAYTSTGAWASE